MSNGLACYSCINCNDPFNSLYIQVLYVNDSLGYYCSVSYVYLYISMKINYTQLENNNRI